VGGTRDATREVVGAADDPFAEVEELAERRHHALRRPE
jgi:hypothetical protein